MKRKWLSMFMVCVLGAGLALTGCGSSNTGSNDSGNAAPAAQESAGEESGAADTGETYVCRMMTQNSDQVTQGQSFLYLADQIEEATNGRVQVETYMNGQLAGAADELNFMRDGAIDLLVTANARTASFNPIEGISQIPFLFTTEPGDTSIISLLEYDEDIAAILDEGAEANGFVRLGELPGESGSQIMCANKAVNSPEDAKGLKIRTPGGDFINLLISEMGATAVSMSSSEFPIAMQQGAVDGVSNDLTFFYKSGWDEYANYVILPFAAYSSNPVWCNQEWWNSLPADIQEAIRDVAIPNAVEHAREAIKADSEEAMSGLKDNGCTFIEWDLNDPEILQFCTDVRQKCIDMAIDQWGDDAQTIIDKALNARKEAGLF